MITARSYQDSRDLDRVGQFLIDTYTLAGRPHNWLIDRWINLRYSVYADSDPDRSPTWEENLHVWEVKDQIAGVAMIEGPGFHAMQVHPAHREIEPEMAQWCEDHHATRQAAENEDRLLRMEAYAWDTQRTEVLAGRGYLHHPRLAWYRRRSLEQPVSVPQLPAGYRLRAMQRDESDKLRYVDALCAIFPHFRDAWVRRHPMLSPEQRRQVILLAVCPRMHAPRYRDELDLCIESDGGEIVCVCTFWLDEVNRLSIIEPMGTHPDHRHRGLARTIMLEGMRRSRRLGAEWAVTTSYTESAHHAYASVGLQEAEAVDGWSRQL